MPDIKKFLKCTCFQPGVVSFCSFCFASFFCRFSVSDAGLLGGGAVIWIFPRSLRGRASVWGLSMFVNASMWCDHFSVAVWPRRSPMEIGVRGEEGVARQQRSCRPSSPTHAAMLVGQKPPFAATIQEGLSPPVAKAVGGFSPRQEIDKGRTDQD